MFVLSTIFSRTVKESTADYVYYSKYHIRVGTVNT